MGCNCAEGTCDYPKKYWMDVKEDFAAFLSNNGIPFEWDFRYRMLLHELTIDESESPLAKQKIKIMIFEKKVDVRYDLDGALKKSFPFALDDTPIVMKLVLALRRDTLNDLAGEKESIIKIFCKILEFFLRMPDKRAAQNLDSPFALLFKEIYSQQAVLKMFRRKEEFLRESVERFGKGANCGNGKILSDL